MYSTFLMIELARCANVIDPKLEYDLTWEQGQALQSEFEESKYDDSDKDEYECIQEWLEATQYTLVEKTKAANLYNNLHSSNEAKVLKILAEMFASKE